MRGRLCGGIGGLIFLLSTESQAGFGQELIGRPTYEHAPLITIQRKGEATSPQGVKDLHLVPSGFSLEVNGKPDNESWTLEVRGQFTLSENNPTKSEGASLVYVLNGVDRPIPRSAKTPVIHLSIPVTQVFTRFQVFFVDIQGVAQRERVEVTLDHFPEAATPEVLPRWLLAGTVGLYFGADYWRETTSLGFTGNGNVRIPRLNGEFNIRRAKTPHSPSWKFHLLGSLEYSLAQSAYATAFAYPLAWNLGLRVSRTHLFGQATRWAFSPFLQLERQSAAYAANVTTVVFTETYNVPAPALYFAIWASLGLKAERIFLGRNFEFSVSGGRSIVGSAWSGSSTLYALGGWLARTSVRADLTQRLWLEVSGEFAALFGGATLVGGGGGLNLGIRF